MWRRGGKKDKCKKKLNVKRLRLFVCKKEREREFVVCARECAGCGCAGILVVCVLCCVYVCVQSV